MYALFRGLGGLWLKLIGVSHCVSFDSVPSADTQYIFIDISNNPQHILNIKLIQHTNPPNPPNLITI
jgi:hypothetical protein